MTKNIAMIIAHKGFRDEELFLTKETLEKSGFCMSVFSNKKGIAVGKFGGEYEIDKTIKDIDLDLFDILLFVGGPGALENLDNEESYSLIKEAIKKEKIVAAICIAPVILTNAGILKGKKATVWSSNMDKSAIKTIEEGGAIYVNEGAVGDGNIITADGPQSIDAFCEKIVEMF